MGAVNQSGVLEDETAIAIRQEMLKNPNINSHRIYIAGQSASSDAAIALVNNHPELWHGMLLISPENFFLIPPDTIRFPRVFISVGNQDEEERLEIINRALMDASRGFIPARVDYQNAKHAYRTQDYRECYRDMAKFILTDY